MQAYQGEQKEFVKSVNSKKAAVRSKLLMAEKKTP